MMRSARRLALFGTAALALACSALRTNAADSPPAETMLDAARAVAAAEHKSVFVHFSASWCSWCRRFESFLHDETIEPILQRHFVFVRLVVRERDPNKALAHPGGMDVLARLGGADRGIPFLAVVDADGKLLTNSLMKVADPQAVNGVENFGYPGEPESIAQFLTMVQTAAPTLTAEERQTLEAWLVAHEPK